MTAVWESHTGEEQLHVVAGSPEQVVVETILAFSRLVEREAGGEPVSRDVTVTGADHGSLLVELLGELVYLAEIEGFVADAATVTLAAGTLHAALAGRLTTVEPLVKGATYHGLRFEQRGGAWDARVVLDV
jgi:SHS2 domain-containing protein